MTPAVSEIYQDVRYTDSAPLEDDNEDRYMTLLVSQLYRIVEVTTLSDLNCALVMNPGLAPIGNLAHLTCGIDGMCSLVLRLAQLNAMTLQTIDIRSSYEVDLSSLIREDDGKYVEYPYLHKLEMSHSYISASCKVSAFKGAVPFPNLRRLCLYAYYPFDDDVIFRGNGSTLEHLNMAFYSGVIAMLQRHRVFAPTSHPKLRTFTYSFLSNERMAFDNASDFMRFALSIAPGAPVRVFPSLCIFKDTPMPALSLLSGCVSIQILSIFDVHLSFWDAVLFIKSLPLLSDLNALAPTLGGIPQDITEAGLPEYVHSTYAPVGKRFRRWMVTPYTRYDNAELATSVLLLALVCPNFDYTAVSKESRESFMEEIKSQIAEPRFSKHAPRLSRLLFDGWQEQQAQ
ncbi:hypothetical protein IW152_002468 [Coemansia sp. BCRC 34962]|nr:hypothetical protein IW152_002468 [Coemansia sp. BCRC 34962]